MAEEFHNAISIYGLAEVVEEMAIQICDELWANIQGGPSVESPEYILLWDDLPNPSDAGILYAAILTESIVFDRIWTKVSLSFKTRRKPFPTKKLDALMRKYPETYLEIQTIGDCSGLIGILAKSGQNLAIRRLDLGTVYGNLTSLFLEFFAMRGSFENAKR